MASVTPPYFLDEFHRPVTRKQPTERERELGLTLSDLDWLNTLYYATDQGRQNPTLRSTPMLVETLVATVSGKPEIELAGLFMMSGSPDAKKSLLYTPYGGIEVFGSHATLLTEVRNRLTNKSQHDDLLRFNSIKERSYFSVDTPFKLTTARIEGAVMQHQENALNACQQQNMQDALEQLNKTPALPEMLDTLLSIMARSYFPNLDQRDTYVSFSSEVPDATGDDPNWLYGSMPLSAAVLQFYLKHAWPPGQTRTYTNPRHITTTFTEAQKAEDLRRWESLVEQTSGIFSKLLTSLLQNWWNEDYVAGQSRISFFAQVMADKFRLDLLLKRQAGILSSEESYHLLGVFLADQATRTLWHGPLSIDKVRILAPYQHYVELSATLLISNAHAYLYTQSRGLQVLKDLDDLNDTLLSMLKAAGHEDELLNFLSLDERSLYLSMDQVQISGMPVVGGVFTEIVEDIAAKQLANMEYALSVFRRSDGRVDLAALLDCALDLRHMLDSRLLDLDTDGRWSLHPITSTNGRPSTVQAERAKQQLLTIEAAQAALQTRRGNQPTLRRLAQHALDQALEIHRLDHKSDEVFFNTYATQAAQWEERMPLRSTSLLDHFIERLARAAGPFSDTPDNGFYGKRQVGRCARWNDLSSKQVNAVVTDALKPFADHDIRTLPRQFMENLRGEMNSAWLLGLRSEAALRVLNRTLAPHANAIIETVMRPDSMTRLRRHGLNGFLPDAYRLTLKAGNAAQLLALANCFVLTERGGLDPDRSGQAVLWTPQRGHEPFASVRALQLALAQRLVTPDARIALLQNLSINHRAPHRRFHLGPLQRIDEHLLDDRQQSYLDFLLASIEHWLAIPLSPKQLQDGLDFEMLRAAPTNLGKAQAIAQAIVYQQALPVWLGMASPQEQMLNAELLEQYRNSAPLAQDYLHGLPPLRDYVASTLQTLLNARFPDHSLNPENILIPARLVLNGNIQSLIDFAMRFHHELQAEQVKPYSRSLTPLPQALDGTAVVQLVRQLGIARFYRDWLETHLNADTDEARERRALFCRQLPWQLLYHAHEEKLEERLSNAAWNFVLQVFDMPDAVARGKVRGATASIYPLELLATPGATPVAVPGVYLIGPQPGATGPLVLYAPYSPLRVFTEFAREADLLKTLNTPGPLQDWVILQLDAPQQSTYRNLLRSTNKKNPSDIRVNYFPVMGNILTRLFADNTQQLIKMLGAQFEKEHRDHWNPVTNLLIQAAPVALQFMAGKLKYPRVVWRSFKLFKASADDLQQQHWGSGLKRFIHGVATLASLRRELGSLFAPDSPPEPATPVPDRTPSAPPAATTATTLDITQPVRTLLQPFENHTIALSELQKNPQTDLYTERVSARVYAPVEGKVYPVKPVEDRWRIALGDKLGPFVQRTAQNVWVLDLVEHEPQYGPALSRYLGRVYTRRGEREAINIEAEGMLAIAALSSWKALCINEALNVATYYTVNCKRNLERYAVTRDPDSRVGLFLTELFGVLNLNPAQVMRIAACVDKVLNELVNPDLIKPDSMRFVIGTAIEGGREGYAFTLHDDREKKIYLVNRFFDPWMDEYENNLTTPFDLSAHARASVLIHEVSHIVCLTEDIAYLDSMRPFHDLINTQTLQGLKMFLDLSTARNNTLSITSPVSRLFQTWDRLSRRWVDCGRYGQTSIRDRVYSETGTQTLNDARQVFMSDVDKRINVILANADSLTYLITNLGRVLDEGP